MNKKPISIIFALVLIAIALLTSKLNKIENEKQAVLELSKPKSVPEFFIVNEMPCIFISDKGMTCDWSMFNGDPGSIIDPG